jgi:hypothetical protein
MTRTVLCDVRCISARGVPVRRGIRRTMFSVRLSRTQDTPSEREPRRARVNAVGYDLNRPLKQGVE